LGFAQFFGDGRYLTSAFRLGLWDAQAGVSAGATPLDRGWGKFSRFVEVECNLGLQPRARVRVIPCIVFMYSSTLSQVFDYLKQVLGEATISHDP
jgi:hypothetical protein